jgi:hypothetical protein
MILNMATQRTFPNCKSAEHTGYSGFRRQPMSVFITKSRFYLPALLGRNFSGVKFILLTSMAVLFAFLPANAQSSFLTPSPGYKSADLLDAHIFSVFDVSEDLVYASDGDTIFCFDADTDEIINKYGKPAGYDGFAGFLTLSPDGSTLWAGYTTSYNTDDRIYAIDVLTGEWTLMATLAGNFDLEFYGQTLLVSGLNSTNWGDPNGVFLLDVSGSNAHRKIIETGGSPAGFSVSSDGDLYYGTSFFTQPNALYRWDAGDVAGVLNDVNADFLTPEDGNKLSDLPESAYDCAADVSGNVVFNFNNFSSSKVLAKWSGVAGGGFNFDTIATASGDSDWLKMVKTRGDILSRVPGNQILAGGFGRPVAEVHLDYLPVLTEKIPNFSGYESTSNSGHDLTPHFSDPDDPDDFVFEITGNSFPEVAQVSVVQNVLLVDFLEAGQTNITLQVTSAGQSVETIVVAGTYPQIEGNFETATFEDLFLEPGSFWNGSDLSGEFQSGPLNFPNFYNPDWDSWSGWAYSNMADDSTAGYLNQYSAITAEGFDVEASEGTNYGVGFVPVDFETAGNTPIPLYFNDSSACEVEGFYVTNAVYTSMSMEYGDDFSQKFGGPTGDDPDYFKLLVYGFLNGSASGPVEYYLADYRFADNAKDYIIKTWQWVELSSLGAVDSLEYTLESSDTGAFGMNTPGYFCIDHIHVLPGTVSISEHPDHRDAWLTVYPNPATDFVKIQHPGDDAAVSTVEILDFTGQKVLQKENHLPGERIDLSVLSEGCYLILVQYGDSSHRGLIIKK